MRIAGAIFITLLILSGRGLLLAGGGDSPKGKSVRINILSKQARLIRQGGIDELVFIIPENAVVEGINGFELSPGDRIRFSIKEGKWHAAAGSSVIRAPFHLQVFTSGGTGTITVKLPDELRYYPLPLEAKCGDDDPHFFVREKVLRYAVDSAAAEYGLRSEEEREAVMALAHIIAARAARTERAAGSGRKRPYHRKFDFCDLTHCQVYRGRIKSGLLLNDTWFIDRHSLKGDLFFHSRCGGHTLDHRVFGSKNPAFQDVKDYLYREGITLCSPNMKWSRTISGKELSDIIFPGNEQAAPHNISLTYNKEEMKIYAISGNEELVLSPETFRLKVNRVRGWNFLKSNLYGITRHSIIESGREKISAKTLLTFTGTGLGHGVGLCQHGALELSRRGYNRYEILEHYFPGISFSSQAEPEGISPYLSYFTYDLYTGRVRRCPAPGLPERKVPPGSFFKLIVSLYLAKERPDIIKDYKFTCPGRIKKKSPLPDRCWKPEGHGTIGFRKALSSSCNLYFASLHKRISYKKFRSFFNNLCKKLDIRCRLPAASKPKDKARILAGLDFSISFSFNDLVKISRLVFPEKTGNTGIETVKTGIPLAARMKIFRALTETFITGTASGDIKPSGPACNYEPLLLHNKTLLSSESVPGELWGKTSTVIDGTNKPLSYGLFIGGYGRTGIVTVLRRGTGHLAAKWALKLLRENK